MDEARVVLAVAVDLHRHLIAVLARVYVPRLHRAADAEVERQAQHRGARRAGALAGRVGRAVVDHEHVEVGRTAADSRHRRPDGPRLVVGGHYCEILRAPCK